MAKNSNNLTLGSASRILIDDVEVGYVEGDVTFQRSAELKKYFFGIPRKTVLQVPIDDQFSTEFQISEITGKNIAIAALNLPVTESAGGAVSYTGGTRQVKTFAAPSGRSLERILLDQPGSSYSVSEMKDSPGDSVTYVEDTDFIVDTVAGEILRIPTGSISPGGSVLIANGYTGLAYQQVELGKTIAIVTKKFAFEHFTPNLRKIEVVLWKAQAAAEFTLAFEAEEWAKIPVKLEALDDSDNNPSNPFGYIRVSEPV